MKKSHSLQRSLWLTLMCALCLPMLSLAQNNDERTRVLIETNKGKLILELYNETPIHRDAFLNNVRSGIYQGVQFHCIIKDFMVQSGYLITKGLDPNAELPEDADQDILTAEILPDKFIHERGAIAAARMIGASNPERRSSPTQFYIITGSELTDADLDDRERMNGFKYTNEQREVYKQRGGAPHLDGKYTVFGRLIDGFKVLDKIQSVPTNKDKRPLKPIIIKRTTIISKQK